MEYKKNLPAAIKVVRDNFTQTDAFIDVATKAVEANLNFLLYGPPGHGKTDMTELFLKTLVGEDIFILPMGVGTKPENLFGPINLKLFQEQSILRYNIEESFISKPAAIFEEGLDAPAYVLEVLKHPISSGKLCQGNECYKSDCRIHVLCTNYNPQEWAEEEQFGKESRLAFLGRFPFSTELKWERYDSEAYFDMFAKRNFGDADVAQEVSIMAAQFHKEGFTITPRNAMYVSRIYKQFGPQSFLNFGYIPSEVARTVIGKAAVLKANVVNQKILREVARNLNAIPRSAPELHLKTLADCARKIASVSNLSTELAEEYRKLRNTVKDLETIAGQNLVAKVNNDTATP